MSPINSAGWPRQRKVAMSSQSFASAPSTVTMPPSSPCGPTRKRRAVSPLSLWPHNQSSVASERVKPLIEYRDDPASWLGVALGAAGTVLSFGLLALSATPALHTFGLTMLFGVGFAWLLSPCFRPVAGHAGSTGIDFASQEIADAR